MNNQYPEYNMYSEFSKNENPNFKKQEWAHDELNVKSESFNETGKWNLLMHFKNIKPDAEIEFSSEREII